MEAPPRLDRVDDGQSNYVNCEAGGMIQTSIDDDIYEDAGDLEFELSSRSIFLSRLPKFLWKAWSQLEESEVMSLGVMRVESDRGVTQRACL